MKHALTCTHVHAYLWKYGRERESSYILPNTFLKACRTNKIVKIYANQDTVMLMDSFISTYELFMSSRSADYHSVQEKER